MPTIAVVDGVRIAIYFNDHPPPHFHAKHAEFEALISIATGDVLDGSLPGSKLRAVRAWLDPRREQIAFVWTEIQARRHRGGLIG